MQIRIRYLIVCILLFNNAIFAKPQLKYVSVVFRHGDRTPDESEVFPNDPNKDANFYPIGLGGLTNSGKLREFRLGEILRERYNDLLGNAYVQESVYARSTDFTRTKMSLQLVLAGLFPPSDIQKWNEKLNWQPIPIKYFSFNQDELLTPDYMLEFSQQLDEIYKMPEVVKSLNRFDGLMKNLSKWTGKPIKDPRGMYLMYHLLVAEMFLNFTLPKWSESIFPYGKLFHGINFYYEVRSYTNNMRKLNGGKVLYNIIKAMKSIKSGSTNKTYKISLFSGHESNIVAIMKIFGTFIPHVPAYSSAILIEFYEINHKFYVKVLYYRGIPEAFITQRILGCNVLCPFNRFQNLIKNSLPSENEFLYDINK